MPNRHAQRENWSYPLAGRALGAVLLAIGGALVLQQLAGTANTGVALAGAVAFGAAVALAGSVLLTSRQGVVIDASEGRVTTWSTVLGRTREHEDSLHRYARVCVAEDGGLVGGARFTVRLEGETASDVLPREGLAGRGTPEKAGLGERVLRWSRLDTLDVLRCLSRGEAIEEGTRLAELTRLPLVEDLDSRAPV